MAIQNIFSGLADQKTYKDFQNEQIAQDLAKQQLLNAQQTNRAGQMGIDETIRKKGIANQIRDIGQASVTTDELGNKTLDKKKLTNSLYAIDPLQASSFEAENAKTAKDLATADLDAKYKQSQLVKQNLDNISKITETANQYLNGVTDENTLLFAKQRAGEYVNNLGIPAEEKAKYIGGINQWNLQNLPQIKAQGLTVAQDLEAKRNQITDQIKQIELGFATNRNKRENTEFEQKQSGVLLPADQQKAVADIKSQIQTFKNANKIDEAEQGFSGLQSLFGKDKSGNIIFRGRNDKTGVSDNALILAYNRAVNPGNQVTLAEGKVTGDTVGWSDRALNYAQKVASGETLNDNQRKEIYDIAKKNIESKRKTVDVGLQPFVNQTKSLNLPADQVFTPQEIKRNKLDANSSNQTKTPASPFSFGANVPPPAYTGTPTIATANGQQVPLGNKPFIVNPNQSTSQTTTPKLALPTKFTELSMEQRKAIQAKAKAKNYTPQEYFNLLRGG